MGQDIKKIETTYNFVSKEYAVAFSNEHEKKPEDQKILRRFSDKLKGQSPVWDFGCGPGQTTKFLKDLGVDISGMDLSEKILELARKKYPDIHFQRGNFLNLEFKDDSLAGVVAFYAIVHLDREQVEALFKEIWRILRPGGRFLLAFHRGEGTIHINEFLGKKVDIDLTLFSTGFIARCLKNAGFEKIETTRRNPYIGVEFETQRAYVSAVKSDSN